MEINRGQPNQQTISMAGDFIRNEVLKSADLISRRKDNLYMALILGTNYNKLVRISAHTTTGIELVEGVILALTDEYVILKKGPKIPICCIEEIRIY